jgi:glycosyltransferase involved in cell wall biosynthesis
MEIPDISIILPVKNGASTIGNAINSILNQSFKSFELIIINDNSTDSTNKIVYSYLSLDPRIRLYSNTHSKGLVSSLNFGIFLAKGRYIARMDADDISLPNRLSIQKKIIESYNYDLVGSKVLVFDRQTKCIYGPLRNFSNYWLQKIPWSQIYLPHPTWFGKAIWFKNNLYRHPEYRLAEDQELLIRTCEDSNFYFIDKVLLLYQKPNFNFKKNIYTRISLLNAQVDNFIIKRKFIYILLSYMNFIFKLIIDISKCIIPHRMHNKNNQRSKYDVFKKYIK